MTTATFGAFGKIPSVGDFFRINAPSGFALVWDEWLQRCLVSGAHAYGSRWDELYMSVPIWRFSLSSGVAGPAPIMGVLMPSVDRVGRRFPLTLMGAQSEHTPVLETHFADDDTFEILESIALSVLDDDISKDALEEKLSSVSRSDHTPAASCRVAPDGSVACAGPSQSGMLASVGARLLARSLQSPTVWSTVLEDDSRLMVCDGLPDGPNMQGLFDLDFDLWREGIL